MEQTPALSIKNINAADEVIRFQLTLSIFEVVYTDHLQALMFKTRMQFHILILFYCRFDSHMDEGTE